MRFDGYYEYLEDHEWCSKHDAYKPCEECQDEHADRQVREREEGIREQA